MRRKQSQPFFPIRHHERCPAAAGLHCHHRVKRPLNRFLLAWHMVSLIRVTTSSHTNWILFNFHQSLAKHHVFKACVGSGPLGLSLPEPGRRRGVPNNGRRVRRLVCGRAKEPGQRRGVTQNTDGCGLLFVNEPELVAPAMPPIITWPLSKKAVWAATNASAFLDGVGVLNCPGPFLGGSGKLFLHVYPVDSMLLGLRRPLLRRELLLDRGLADRCGLLLPPLCYGSGSRSSDGNGTNLSSGGNCRSCRWSGGWSSGGWTDGGWEEYCRRLMLCLLFRYFYPKYTGYMGIWCLSNTLKSPQIFFPKNTIP
jgi:hypothetical protein